MTHLGSIAVAGASLAGLRAAEEIRRLGFAGRLTIVGEESHFPPFDRPPLSKDALGADFDVNETRLRLFQELDAELVLGVRATGLDLVARSIKVADGSTVEFDGLVIATGAAVRRLKCAGSDLEGVHYVRTVEDCNSLRGALEGNPKVVVIGAGFIGSEVAAACRRRDMEVTIVDAETVPMAEKIGSTVAQFLMDEHERNGCQLRLGVGVSSIEGQTRVQRVRLTDGTLLEADVVVAGIGVVPETDWLEGSGLVIEDGVVCDEFCGAVGTHDVVAVGDVARWHNPRYGQTMRVEHWTNAVEQAEYAAAVLLHGTEEKQPYAPAPYFWSDQYDLKLQFAGQVHGELELIDGSLEERQFLMISRDGDLDVGALAVSWPSKFLRHRRALNATDFATVPSSVSLPTKESK